MAEKVFTSEINSKTIREFIGHTAELSGKQEVSKDYMLAVLSEILDYVEFLENNG